MRQINLLCVLGFLCLLGACGGNGGGDRMRVAAPDPEAPPDPPPDTPDPPPDSGMVSGQFKDANVSGLTFESGSHVGITDANGGFTCDAGQEIEFSVGAVVLGSSSCTEVVTPLNLFPGSTLDTPEVLNLVRFLLMLDADGNATNGIEISDAVQLRAENWAPVDFAAADLDAELAPIHDDLADVDLRDLPDAREARAHLLETMQCVHSGVYWLDLGFYRNRYLPGIVTILPTEVDGVSLVGTVVSSDKEGAISFGEVTRVEFTDDSPETTFNARFTSAHRLEGTWGTDNLLEGERAGHVPDALYRFVGFSDGGGGVAVGLTINLTDSVHATAVESLLNWWADGGYDYVYEGRLQDGRLELISAEGDVTLTGTVDLEATPPTITATWNDSNTGTSATYTTYGCRLN